MKLLKKSNSRINALLLIQIFGVGLSLIGTTVGTYCWFEYNAHADVEYSGTAVGATNNLKIGLVSETKLNGFAEKHGLFEDKTSVGAKYIYWLEDNNALSSSAIMDYQNLLGHASNKLVPVTSSNYKAGDEFSLISAPGYLKNNTSKAKASEFSNITFAFRTSQGNSDIFLRKCRVDCSDNAANAIRLFFKNPHESTKSILYNPTSLQDGTTDVGGLLNLDARTSDCYDYATGSDKEFIYGKANVTYSGEKHDGSKPVAPSDITTFNANHEKDMYVATIEPEKVIFSGNSSVLENKQISYVSTNESISLVDVSIFLEGWDHACIDTSVEKSFNLDLEFSFKVRN